MAVDQSTAENLRAFARLCGYLRFFHPSDEAAAVDWDAFAVLGVRRVLSARDADDLRGILASLAAPVAPTVRVYHEDDTNLPPVELTEDEVEDLEVVAWQHRGVELDYSCGMYRSVRTNREDHRPRDEWAGISQDSWATTLRGRDAELTCVARVAEADMEAMLVALVHSVEDGRYRTVSHSISIRATEWAPARLTFEVPENALRVEIQARLMGAGAAHFDEFALSTRPEGGAWEPVPLAMTTFRDAEPEWEPAGWNLHGTGCRIEVCDDPERGQVVRIASTLKASRFEQSPSPGEVLYCALGSGLAAALPVALYSGDGRTIPAADPALVAELDAALQETDVSRAALEDHTVRLAAVVVAWSTLQHFYPYFDVVDTDWDAAFIEAVKSVGTGDFEAFIVAMQHMLAELHDGHARVSYPRVAWRASPPIRWEEVNGEIVATAIGESVEDVRVGDVLQAVDDMVVDEALAASQSRHSGSTQTRRLRGAHDVCEGPSRSVANLSLRRGARSVTAAIKRTGNWSVRETRPDPVCELEAGIFYVDWTKAHYSDDIEPRLPELAAAAGVVVDCRGYPTPFGERLLGHMTDEPSSCAQWLVPQIIYPDRERLAGYDPGGRWSVEPRLPRFTGNIVFLTNAAAISYAESIMGIVEHYALGPIVGSPTAGTNGNVSLCPLPGGGSLTFTGMRVLKHDGSQHHLIGIQPSVRVERTVDGIAAGRDEVLERALELL